MPNKYYVRSRLKENTIKHMLEKDGWYCIRASGSKGVADIVAIKVCKHVPYALLSKYKSCDERNFHVKFIQVKVSKHIKLPTVKEKTEKLNTFKAIVEYWLFPVRGGTMAKKKKVVKKTKGKKKKKK